MKNRIMKKSKIITAFIIVFSFIFTSSLSGLAEGASRKKEFYRNLSKRLSNNRNNYAYLTDNEFANFREIHTTGIGKGRLYRSSSPVKPWGNRNVIADNAAREAGIKTFINLADSDKSMKALKGFNETYYSTQKYIGLKLNVKFMSKDFQKGVAKGIKFMAMNEPPYLIHCDLGKDRAGLFSAVIECLMGASSDEVVDDFLVSFWNYFGIESHSRDYEYVADNEIRQFLAAMFGVKDIEGVNLKDAAERYALRIGVSAEEIEILREKLR